jgi:aryl carrier-like protein
MSVGLTTDVQYVVTVNVETERNEEGVMFRYWTNIMSDEQAAQLARTMADVLESFVNQPGQTIAELDPPKQGIETQIIVQSQPQPPTIHTHHTIVQPQIESPTIHTHHTVVHSQVIPTPVLDNNATLKKMVSECVQQVIGEMLKSGLLLPRTPDVASIQQQEQQQELQVVHSTDDEFEVNSPVVRNPKIHLDPYHFAGNETNVRRSMARQLSKRGRSAATEKKLLAVWSLMLDIPEDSISGDDSFFELGGDSITAMKLVGAAREEGLTLTVADVFRHPTFDDMAAIIRVASLMGTFITDADLNEYNEYNAHNNAIHQMPESEMYERFSLVKASNIDAFLQSSICPKVGVFKGGIADVLPVTDFQSLAITGTLLESRWMLNYFYLDGAGALDLRLLKQSCFRLVQAFDILRTVFLPSGDRFLQVVLRKMRPDFQVFETEQDLGEFTTMLQQKDRDQGPRLGEPFVQFTVAKQKDSDRHRIFVRISHAQYDGICLPRILAALQSGYQLEPIPPTPSFADYVRASASTVTSDHYQHWKRLLKGSSMTEIVRRSGPNYRRSAGATMSLKQNIHLPSVAHGNITTATVVKAAWALVLAQLSARSDVVFGHTISGRNAGIPGVENIIGPCLNLVPVRVQFEPHWTALDLLRHVQDQQVANMPYEALGFREITKHCTEWPDWTNFTTAVQHQNVDRGTEMQLGDNMYTVGAVGTDEDFSDFSILSTPLEESDMLEIRLCFSLNGVITKVFAEQVLGMLCNAAESFSARPNTILPSPNELCSLPRQAVDEVAATSDDLFQSNALQNLSRAELLVLSDILSRAWRQVLRNDKGESTAGAENLQLDNSFFELGGDIMGLAQVAWLLEQEGFKLRVEDLIDHPTMLGQMAVLGLHIATERQKVMEAHIPLNGAATPDRLLEGREPLMLSRVGKSRTFGKAVGLAKRMVKKNARTHR